MSVNPGGDMPPGGPEPHQVAGNGGRRVPATNGNGSGPSTPSNIKTLCESAVDPLEIAAGLEFEGFSDELVRARYGVPDVFALAEEAYRRVPRRPAEPEPTPDPWQVSRLRPALHGLLYGLPAVCFTAAGGLLAGPYALRVLVASLLTSWAASQGLAYLGYLRLGRTNTDQARRVLRTGLAVGMLAVGLVMAGIALVVPAARVPTLLFGTGQGAYMLGASVLMVLGAERLLLVVLAPGVLGGTAFLLLGRPPGLEHAAWAALVATPVLALVLAVAVTARSSPDDDPGSGRALVGAELRAALPTAAFGFLAAALLAFPVVVGEDGTFGTGGINTGALLAALPLSLSMGAAEWSLLWYRRRTQRLLRTTRRPRPFARRARWALLAATTQYLGAAAALIAAVVTIAAVTGLVDPEPTIVPQLGVYLALGGAMFLALLLQTLGGRTPAVLACAAALAVEILLRSSGVFGQLVACVGLFALLGGHALVVLGRTVRHAY